MFSSEAMASIQRIAMRANDNGTLLSLVMDKPLSLKTVSESDEVFIIDGFSLNDWAGDKKGEGQGDIKEYYIEDYSSGSAELVVRTNPGFRIASATMVPKGSNYHYEVLLSQGDGPPPSNGNRGSLVVDKVQVGQSGQATRLVIYLNRSANFAFSTNATGTETLITPDERMRWEAQTTMKLSSGLFKSYELLEQEDRMVFKIKTMPGTKVGNASIQDANSSNPKYVVDLMPDTISNASENGLFDPQSNNPPPLGIPGWEASPADMPGGSPIAQAPRSNETGLIQSMDILTQNDDTIIKFVTKEPLNLDVTENEYTNQVIIHLPKIDWINVNALDKNGGLIDGYKIDQSSLDGTNLILNVRKGTHVIGKKTVSGGDNQAHRFIVHLNQNEHKLPEWLMDATTEALSYEAGEKEELETTQMVYRGGIAPRASIGQGPYAGWNLNFFGSEDKQEATNTTGGATRKLFSGVTGAGFDGYVGFGLELPSALYLGGELMLGHYFNKQTRSYKNTPLSANSSLGIGMTWGGSVRVGGYVSPMALLYARLGAVGTDFWFRGSKSSTGDVIFPGDYSKRNRTGFLYGVGIDAAYNDYTSVRFELNQVTYQTFKYNAKNTAGVVNDTKHRFILNQFSLGMTHHFSPLSGPAAAPIYDDSVVRGLYGGVLFALNNMYSKRDFTNKSGVNNINYYGGSSNSDPVWGFYVGYARAKGRFYYAGEADISLSESVTKERIDFAPNNYESFEDSLKWRWGAVGRFGYIVNHGVVGYAKLGLAAGKFSRSFDNSPGAPGTPTRFAAGRKFDKYILGIRTGGGLEITVNRALGVRGDWTLDYYPKVDIRSTVESKAIEKQTILDNRFGIGLTVYLSEALSSIGLGTAF